MTLTLAYFISAHGFGHAARGAAVMAALQELEPALRFEIFTRIPRRFFEDSLKGPFNYHPLQTDIGVVQKSSLTEDLPETVRQLDQFLPFDPALIKRLARQLNSLKCRLILCDIAPLGLAAARAANLPSLLIENFTWDWIYEGYRPYQTGLERHIAYLQQVFERADYRIQAEPVCQPHPADLVITAPISRKFRRPAREIRQELAISNQAKVALITLGGIRGNYEFLDQLREQPDIYFIIPGAVDSLQTQDNLRLLSHHSDFFHPDLINAANVVIGKLGYSTLAEVYQAGIPFGHITRQKSPESRVLEAYFQRHMQGLAISKSQFQTGRWLDLLPELLTMPRLKPGRPNGADEAARFVLERI